MKIIKFIKNKNGMYTLELDNNLKIKIHEDLILKYDLLLSKEVTDDTLEVINNENRIYEVYEIALKYINTKLRSNKELKNYLKNKGYDIDVVDEVLNMLKEQNYIDDKYYANSYVHDRMVLSNEGPNKIKEYLSNQGISYEVIEEAISSYKPELEKEKIDKIVDKQIRLNNNKGGVVLKKKIQMYLLNLGYNYDLINDVLNSKNFVSKDIYKKEYEKAYKDLSKKYSGKELEYKLKQKMYQKGFSTDDFYE